MLKKPEAFKKALPRLGKEPDFKIAADVGVNPRTVLMWRRKLGVEAYRRPRADLGDAIEQYLAGVPVKQIRVGADTLYRALRERGIPLRKPRTRRGGGQ